MVRGVIMTGTPSISSHRSWSGPPGLEGAEGRAGHASGYRGFGNPDTHRYLRKRFRHLTTSAAETHLAPARGYQHARHRPPHLRALSRPARSLRLSAPECLVGEGDGAAGGELRLRRRHRRDAETSADQVDRRHCRISDLALFPCLDRLLRGLARAIYPNLA